MSRRWSKLAAILLRRGWIVILATVAVVAIALLIDSAEDPTFTAEAVVLVPAGATPTSPGNATQAVELAQTYIEAIPEDGGVLSAVAARIRRPSSEVTENLSVVGNPSTSVLRLRYEDIGEGRAVAGTRALLSSVTGPQPLARGVAPGSIEPVRRPHVVSETAGSGSNLPIAIFLGLCLGMVLLVAWERADGRIDDLDDLSRALGAPATDVDALNGGNVAALFERWDRLTHAGEPAEAGLIGLLAGGRRSEATVARVAARLELLGRKAGFAVELAHEPFVVSDGARLRIVTGGAPGGASAGERIGIEAALVVLSVRRGTRVAELRSTLAVLQQFGVRSEWAILVRRRGPRSVDETATGSAPADSLLA